MFRKSALFLLVVLALVGCKGLPADNGNIATPGALQSPLSSPIADSPVPTPAAEAVRPDTVAAGMAAIGGKVDLPVRWRHQDILIYAAPFVPTENESTGFFVLEPSVHPHATLAANGTFWFNDVEPGQYVLIVGPNPDEGVAVRDGDQPKIVTAVANEALDLGELFVP